MKISFGTLAQMCKYQFNDNVKLSITQWRTSYKIMTVKNFGNTHGAIHYLFHLHRSNSN